MSTASLPPKAKSCTPMAACSCNPPGSTARPRSGGAGWYRTPAGLEAACTPLLRHLMLFFIPAVAGVMTQFALVADEWLPFLAACTLGTALTLVVTAMTLRWSLRRMGQEPPR